MAYGTVKVDNITFTNGGVDTTITVSGINASTSGNLTVTGTVSGTTTNFVSGTFSTRVSGLTVAGTSGTFTSLTGTTTQGTTASFTTGTFTTLTGTTTQGTTANFASGVFTTQISGALLVAPAGSATTPSISVGTGTTYAPGIYSPGTDQLALATGGTGRVFVDSSGRVGIGASGPSYIVDVSGTNATSSTLRVSTTATSDATIITKTSLGSFLFGTGIGTATKCWNVYDLEAATERLRITSAGLVGIGTSSPGASLHVAGAITSAPTGSGLLAGINGNYGQAKIYGTTGGILDFGASGADANARLLVDNSSSAIQFYTNNGSTLGERVRITSAGLVGIGTSSPSQALDVNGIIKNNSNVYLTNGSQSSPGYIYANYGLDNSDVYIQAGNSAGVWSAVQITANWNGSTNTGGKVALYTAGTERVRITSAGLMGIGTTSPTFVLDVSGGAGTGIRYQNTANSIGNIIGADSSTGQIGTTTGHPLAFLTGATEKARIDTSGRLLVGTSSDSGGALLQVNGDRVRIATAKTPASAAATGTTGEVCWDSSYIYVCTATNTWKRAALSTW
jgi:hypothetical protein